MRTGIAAIMVLVACGKGGGEDKEKAESRTMAARATEAEIHLRSLQKALDTYYAEMASFPEGDVPLTPPKPCCQGHEQQCPAGGFDAEVWQRLHFSIDVPHRFQFSYANDGTAVVVQAVGDLDCDGTATTYTLNGRVEGGSPVFAVQRPAQPD
jgi:hypothetical protein